MARIFMQRTENKEQVCKKLVFFLLAVVHYTLICPISQLWRLNCRFHNWFQVWTRCHAAKNTTKVHELCFLHLDLSKLLSSVSDIWQLLFQSQISNLEAAKQKETRYREAKNWTKQHVHSPHCSDTHVNSIRWWMLNQVREKEETC